MKRVKELMKQADIFVHHSITASNGDQEGIPNVIMEAMATGLPIISTYHAGIPELITDEFNGYLVEEKDSEEYAKKIRKLLTEDISFIPLNARKTIEEKFNLKKQQIKLNSIYEELLT